MSKKDNQKLSQVRDFREWYEELNEREKREFRHEVMQECEISEASFYNYLDQVPSKPIRKIIERISNETETTLWPSLKTEKQK